MLRALAWVCKSILARAQASPLLLDAVRNSCHADASGLGPDRTRAPPSHQAEPPVENSLMIRNSAVIPAAILLAALSTPVLAASIRYANQGDLKSLDPYTLNETTTNAHLGHVYEGLTRRGKDLAVQPALAERWEIGDDGLTWRFYLRKGVKFHNGNDFNADDVIFSANRVRAQGS